MHRKDSHKVSVVIPSAGRSTLKLVVASLEAQSRKPDEIIVSEDEKFYGASWPRNRGIEKTKGDIIAFADDDCIYPPDWLERLISAMDKYDAAGVGGTYIDTDPLLQDIRVRKGVPTVEGVDNQYHVGVGGNVMYRKFYLEKLNRLDGYCFDEEIVTGEDADLAARVLDNGGKLVFVPTYATHLKRVNFRKYLKMQYYRGIGIAQLHAKAKRLKVDLMRQSLLRKEEGFLLKRLWLIFWRKGLGPFDIRNFSSFHNFVCAWFGQKAEMVGFARETIAMKFKKRRKSIH